MNKTLENAVHRAPSITKFASMCILMLLTAFASNLAHANESDQTAGIIDGPSEQVSGLSRKELRKELRKEQKALRKESRKELQTRAKKGERLAQVVLGSDFASEAQMLTFAPAAANDALGDALSWYSLAAQRGYPGSPSLDQSGVNFFPVRVIRSK